MFVRRHIPARWIFQFSWRRVLIMTLTSSAVVVAYVHLGMTQLAIPFLPLSVIGTAVAFYVGFKNNNSYDRLWEARKIWGGIVNDSRSWAVMSLNHVSNLFRSGSENVSEDYLRIARRTLIYRHLAWINALRTQLREYRSWEHGYWFNFKMKERLDATFGHLPLHEELLKFLEPSEIESLLTKANPATQILSNQSAFLKSLREKDLIDDFRLTQMQELITQMYTHQGQAERIKNFPFPRQYADFSEIFIWIFIVLLPFGMIAEFESIHASMVWLTVPFTVLIGWFFHMMEMVADYSENPFENSINDVPMTAMCRGIEIDLREMLGEDAETIPPPLKAESDLLM